MDGSEIDVIHRAYYDEELRRRADRPLTEGRRLRVEEFAARCRREGVRNVVEVGLWGSDEDGEWTDRHGRYFRHRPDDDVRRLLAEVGVVEAFEATDHGLFGSADENVHYQWARVRIA